MKTKLFFLFLCLGILNFAQQTYVPDDNFEQILIDLGYDNVLDNYVETANIVGVTELIMEGMMINDLTGIEDFTELSVLNCSNNYLTILDLSGNLQLTDLDCSWNELTFLNISFCSELKSLNCERNDLPNLDVSFNSKVEFLKCNNNELASLVVTENPLLTSLHCNNNNLPAINLENNPLLRYLYVHENVLFDLDVSHNPDLRTLICRFNNMDELNVSNNSEIRELDCNSNQLTYLDVSSCENLITLKCQNNQLTNLDVSNHQFLEYVETGGNQLSDINLNGCVALNNIDLTSNQLANLDFSTNIALRGVACANNQLTELDFSNNVNLEDLSCQNNQLNDLNFQDNPLFSYLSCRNNQLVEIDLSQNPLLDVLDLRDNQLLELNVQNGNNQEIENSLFKVTNNPNLNCIQVDDVSYSESTWTNIDAWTSFSQDCDYDLFTIIYDSSFEQALINLGYDDELNGVVLSENIQNITVLNIPSLNIENLKGIEDFTALEELDCGFNELNGLDVSQNLNLKKLVCGGGGNVLTELDLSPNQLLEWVDCRYAYVEIINLNGLTHLNYLNAWGNQISQLDLSTNINLTELRCDSNELTELDVANNPTLEVLMCSDNQIEELELFQNPNLTVVICDHNQIEHLDISANPEIFLLLGANNQLKSLNLKNRAEMQTFDFESKYNTDLLCIEVDDEEFANSNWNDPNFVDSWSSFSEDCNYMSTNELDFATFKIYPNPTKNLLNFSENLKEFTIYDLSGKLILKGNGNQINVSYLSIGTYLLKGITDSGKTINQKFIKN